MSRFLEAIITLTTYLTDPVLAMVKLYNNGLVAIVYLQKQFLFTRNNTHTSSRMRYLIDAHEISRQWRKLH